MGIPVEPTDERFAPVEIINICDWTDAMGFDYMTKYEVTVTALDKYLEEHPDTTYWSAPREEFFHSVAAMTAWRGGFTKVIVEDSFGAPNEFS